MNFSFAGLHGTGKSTIAKTVAQHFNFSYYSTGMAFRELAKEKKMSLEEFNLYSEKKPEIDKELDAKILTLAKSGKDYVFEGQLPTYMLGKLQEFSILLTCDEEVRIKRMMERDEDTYEDKRHETLVREESERQRFIDLYDIDIQDSATILANFNLIIDTTKLSIKTIGEIAIKALSDIVTP